MHTYPTVGSLEGLTEKHIDALRDAAARPRFCNGDLEAQHAPELTRNLVARGLVREAGRLPVKGSPKLYTVTDLGRLFLAARDLRAAA